MLILKIKDDSFRVGFAYLPLDNSNFYSGFFESNFDFGRDNKYFKLGIGLTFTYLESPRLYLTGRLGYRYN